MHQGGQSLGSQRPGDKKGRRRALAMAVLAVPLLFSGCPWFMDCGGEGAGDCPNPFARVRAPGTTGNDHGASTSSHGAGSRPSSGETPGNGPNQTAAGLEPGAGFRIAASRRQ